MSDRQGEVLKADSSPVQTRHPPWDRLGKGFVGLCLAAGGIGGLLVGLASAHLLPGQLSSPSHPGTTTTTDHDLGHRQELQTGKERVEIADVRSGIAVYTNNLGVPTGQSITIGTPVKVSCWVPNYTGIKSINSFYRLETRPWVGKYASANQFANGAPVGVTTNTHPIDPRVQKC